MNLLDIYKAGIFFSPTHQLAFSQGIFPHNLCKKDLFKSLVLWCYVTVPGSVKMG